MCPTADESFMKSEERLLHILNTPSQTSDNSDSDKNNSPTAKQNNGKPTKLSRNMMDLEFLHDLHRSFSHISASEDAVRACVLHAPVHAAHFSTGLDLKWAAGVFCRDVSLKDKAAMALNITTGLGGTPSLTEPGMPARRNMAVRHMVEQMQRSITAVARCRVPVIASIHGYCIGGGVDLASACDCRFASRDAVLSVKEAQVGITADLGTLQRLPPIVGQGITREWAYTARDVTAEEGRRSSFYNDVFDSPAATLQHAVGVAQEIATKCSPLAVQGTKESLNAASEPVVQQGLDRIQLYNAAFLKSDDLTEAAVAFAKKQSPCFTSVAMDYRAEFPK